MVCHGRHDDRSSKKLRQERYLFVLVPLHLMTAILSSFVELYRSHRGSSKQYSVDKSILIVTFAAMCMSLREKPQLLTEILGE